MLRSDDDWGTVVEFCLLTFFLLFVLDFLYPAHLRPFCKLDDETMEAKDVLPVLVRGADWGIFLPWESGSFLSSCLRDRCLGAAAVRCLNKEGTVSLRLRRLLTVHNTTLSMLFLGVLGTGYLFV